MVMKVYSPEFKADLVDAAQLVRGRAARYGRGSTTSTGTERGEFPC